MPGDIGGLRYITERDPVTNAPISERLTILYHNPFSYTRLHISLDYQFNEDVPSALENHVLQSKEYDWEENKKTLLPLIDKELDTGNHKISLIVTVFAFQTNLNGEIKRRSFENVSEKVPRLLAIEIPTHVKKIDVSEYFPAHGAGLLR